MSKSFLKSVERIKKVFKETDDCITLKPRNKDGYVDFQYRENGNKIHLLGHRVSYEYYNKTKLCKKNIVRHTCDNPPCINPRHLILGTPMDNVMDRVKRNRGAVGRFNGKYKNGYYSKYDFREKPKKDFSEMYNRKLDLDKVNRLKNIIKSRGKKSLKKISIEENVSYNTVRDVSCGRIYNKI